MREVEEYKSVNTKDYLNKTYSGQTDKRENKSVGKEFTMKKL